MKDILSFGISVAAGVAIEGAKWLLTPDVKKEIQQAFDEALKGFCPNRDIREREKENIREIILAAAGKPSSDLRERSVSGNYSSFFHRFEEALAGKQKAYNRLKEIRDEARFLETKTELQRLSERIENSNASAELEVEFKRQLTQYEKNLNSFKPNTAYENIIALEKAINESKYKASTFVKSGIEYLKAQCLEYMAKDNKDEWAKSFLRAYQFDSSSIQKKEMACRSYYALNEYSKAVEIANDILKTDEFNSMVWAYKTMSEEGNELVTLLKKVPSSVREEIGFKRVLFFGIKRDKYLDLQAAFVEFNIVEDVNSFDGDLTTYQNYKERAYLVNCAIAKISKQYINFERIQFDVDIFQPIEELLQSFLDGLKFAETDVDITGVRFWYLYLKFGLTQDQDHVYLMKECFSKLENTNDQLILLMSNALQIIKQYDEALELINSRENKSHYLLTLQAICYAKKSEKENYISTVNQYIEQKESVLEPDQIQLISMIDVLVQFGMVDKLSSDILFNKNFEQPAFKTLLVELVKIQSNKANEVTIINLVSVKRELSSLPVYIKSVLANCFLLIKDYQNSIEVYDSYVNPESESEDLMRLIKALFDSKTNNKRSLELLKHWRENYSFQPSIHLAELGKRRQLLQWEECVCICLDYFDKGGRNETAITIFSFALRENSNGLNVNLKKLSELVDEIEFEHYSNCRIVAQVLLENGMESQALELYYQYAIDEKKSEARTDFLWACLMNGGNYLKEIDQVEFGSFVRYEFNEKTFIDEVKEGDEHLAILLGHKIGDEITITSKLGKHEEKIIIRRIMNKYLALHDQIIIEVNNKSPLSKMPMQSFDVGKYIEEGRIMDFFKEHFGEPDSEESKKKTLEEYYLGNISYSQLVAQNYRENFVEAYYDLEHEQKGIAQFHPMEYPRIELSNYDQLILDFASLLKLFELDRNKGVKYSIKFIVPNSILTLIREYASKGIIRSGNGYDINREFYIELINWVEQNCSQTVSENKLDLLHQLPNDFLESNVRGLFMDYFTLLIDHPKSIIISDDSIFHSGFPINSGRIIGANLFLLISMLEGEFLSKDDE